MFKWQQFSFNEFICFFFQVNVCKMAESYASNETDSMSNSTDAVDIGGITLENAFAASIIFISATASFLLNGIFGIFSATSTKLNRQLALLNIAISVCDCGGLAIFALWTAPMTLL
jgi:hypothetical protein